MSDSPKYKIVLWMVWVQIALLPVIYLMLNATSDGLMWRWNLLNRLMVGGYLIGLLAFLVSRGLELQPLLSQESYGTFVYPDNFAEINYEGGEISYTDSISYDIDFSESDSLRIIIYDGKFPHLSIPKNTISSFSPNEVKTFIEKLEGGKR